MTLLRLLQHAVETYGSQSAASRAIGLSRTRVNRILQGSDGDDESFEVVNCLKLAKALGQPPSQVLRAAGKQEEANLIEELYGASSSAPLTADEQSLLQVYRRGGSAKDVMTAVNELSGRFLRTRKNG